MHYTTQYEEQNDTKSGQKEANIEQYHKKAGDIQEKEIIDICAKSGPAQVNAVNRTRSGCIVKKTRQAHIHINTVKAQPACEPPLKNHTADHIIFKF